MKTNAVALIEIHAAEILGLQHCLQRTGDRFGQLARIISAHHCQSEYAADAMTLDPKCLKETARALPQCVLRQNRITKSRLHQSLDSFRVIRFHYHARGHSNLFELSINDLAQVASLGIKQEWHVSQISWLDRPDASVSGLFACVPQNQQLLFKQRHNSEAIFRHRERDQAQIKAAAVQAFNGLFGWTNRNSDLSVRILFSQLPQRLSQLINQRGHAGRKMKWTRVPGNISLKFLLDLTGQPHQRFGVFCQSQSRGCRLKLLAIANKEFGVQLIGQIVQLQAYCSGRQAHFLRCPRHARRFHDGQK